MAQLRPVPDEPVDDAALTEGQMTLWEHLGELRDRIIKAVIAIALGGVVAFVFYPQILHFLIHPYCNIPEVKANPQGCNLYIRAPMDGFILRFKIAGYGGLFLASPIVFWQIWKFMAPGLYEKEKKYAIPFMVASVSLFALGAALAFWTTPKALNWLFSIGGDQLKPLLEPVSYLTFILLMMVAFGLGFEFPVILVALQLLHVVPNQKLRDWRRPAIVVIVVIVAVITPSGDPYSLLALSIPMVVFYEGSIIAGRIIERRRARAATASSTT